MLMMFSDGCGATATTKSTYGDSFNSAQGGVYVTQLEANFLKIWHFPRSSIPADITAGKPDPSGWGKPMADFEKANGGCDVGATFQSQTIVSSSVVIKRLPGNGSSNARMAAAD